MKIAFHGSVRRSVAGLVLAALLVLGRVDLAVSATVTQPKAQPAVGGSANTGWWALALAAIVFVVIALARGALTAIGQRLGKAVVDLWARRPGAERRMCDRYLRCLATETETFKVPFRSEPLDLANVYVALRAQAALTHEPEAAQTVVTQHPRVVVLGPAGAGKSLMIGHLAHQVSRRAIDRRRRWFWLRRASVAPDDFSGTAGTLVPFIIPMRRLARTAMDLEAFLIEELRRRDLHEPERLLRRLKQQKRLWLLFDGLDEVRSAQRLAALDVVETFLAANASCRCVMTCRTADFREDYSVRLGRTYELMPFDQRQMLRFLQSWDTAFPVGVAPASIIAELRSRPRIFSIATNPLLLTITAHLYCELPEFKLPQSRAEFYDAATELLLSKWHGREHIYPASERRHLLEHIALYSQDRGARSEREIGTFTLDELADGAREVARRFGRSEAEARAMLDEVIERSGLLLQLDDDLRYQFTHLSLQEFFAAKALRSDPESIRERFALAPQGWREPLRLWCGLVPDATSMIQAIQDTSVITALECVAEAKVADPQLANALVDACAPLLAGSEDESALVQSGLGLLAAQEGRGDHALTFLAGALTDEHATAKATFTIEEAERLSMRAREMPQGTVDARELRQQAMEDAARARSDARAQVRAAAAMRRGAVEALAQTNARRAVPVLARSYSLVPEAREALLRLGDVAIAFARQAAEHDEDWAFELLAALHSPLALKALVDLLGSSNETTRARSAFVLLGLLGEDEVGQALAESDVRLPPIDRAFEWMWQPYGDVATQTGHLGTVLAARMSSAVETQMRRDRNWWSGEADPRVLVPLVCVGETPLQQVTSPHNRSLVVDLLRAMSSDGDHHYDDGSPLRGLLRRLPPATMPGLDPAWYDAADQIVTSVGRESPAWTQMMLALPPELRGDLVLRLLSHIRTQMEAAERVTGGVSTALWIAPPNRDDFNFDKSWHFFTAAAVAIAISGVALASMAAFFATDRNSGEIALALSSACVAFCGWSGLTLDVPLSRGAARHLRDVSLGPIWVPRIIWSERDFARSGDAAITEWAVLVSVCETLLAPVVVGWAVTGLAAWTSWVPAAVATAAAIAFGAVVWTIGSRKDRKSRNPLRGLKVGEGRW